MTTHLVTCSRCKQSAEGFATAPLPPPQGPELSENTCRACFQDWMNTEVMIINEYRLDLAVPRNQDMLNQEMARFLNLPSADGQAAAGAPPGATPQAQDASGDDAHAGHDHGEHSHAKKDGGGSCC